MVNLRSSQGFVGGLALAATLGCRPAARPAAEAPTQDTKAEAPPPWACPGPSIFAVPRESWHRPTAEPWPCEPAAGRAGWVTAKPITGIDSTKLESKLRGPAATPAKVVMIGLAGAGRSFAADEVQRWRALAGEDAEVRTFAGAALDRAALTRELAALSDRIGRDTRLRLAIRGATTGEGAPFGCVPLADGCMPLAALRAWWVGERSSRRAVVVEGGDPALSLALWSDPFTAVAALREEAAAKRFWAARDGDGDAVVSLRERFVAAKAKEKDGALLDGDAVAAWGATDARAPGPGELAAPRDRSELEALARGVGPGEALVVYLADRECVDCEMIGYRAIRSIAKRTPGLKFAAIRDARALAGAMGWRLSLVEPTIVYYGERGRLIGVADDPTQQVAALPTAALALETRRAVYEAWLMGADLERAKFAAAAQVQLDGGGEEPLVRMARRIHADSEPDLVVAVLSALSRQKWLAAVAAPEVLSHIDHPDTRVRAFALDALFALGPEPGPVLCPLIGAVPDPNPGIRERVRKLLFGFLRDMEAGVPALARLLVHDDAAVRRAAVEAFAELNAGERGAFALPELVHLYLSEPAVVVRRLALQAIARLGAGAGPALPDLSLRLVGEPDPESRRLLAEILGNIGAPAVCAREGLVLLVREDEPAISHEAAGALGRIDALVGAPPAKNQ